MIVIVEVIHFGETYLWDAYFACIAILVTYLASSSLAAKATMSHTIVKNLSITFANMLIKQMCVLLSDNKHITQQW